MLKRKLGPLLYGVLFPGKRVTLLAESTLVMFSECVPLPESRDNNSDRAYSDCLALTELTRLGEPK